MKKNSRRAQTTRLASFVPFFVVAALPALYFVNIIYKALVSIKKNKEKQEKTHVGPEQRVWRCSGPFSLRLPPCCVFYY